MIFPENFENKVGFTEIRTLLKGRCMSTLGTEWVDNEVKFMSDWNEVVSALHLAQEFSRFMSEEDDVYEENFFDVRQALLRIRPERTHLEEIELFDLKRSLKTISDLIGFFLNVKDAGEQPHSEENNGDEAKDAHAFAYPELARMSSYVKTFPELIAHIESVLNKFGKVKDTASPELLSIRHQLEVTSRSVTHSLRQIIVEAQTEGYIDRDVTPTLRDGRLVIPVAPALKRKIKGIVHDESATGKTVFIEPAAVVEANNKVRELKAAERREIIRILQEMTAEIRPDIPEILASLHYLAHIDYLRALAGFSEAFDSVVPEVKPEPNINWSGAIHPLLQQSLRRHGSQQVPLDIALRGGKKIVLISGPNAGGKSVCLKTVGLLQYMMQCGMPVPMHPDSTMGVFKDIFISIGDEQSIEDDLSTYSSHLLSMKHMMKHSSGRSLLLIDEFGSGTEPQIGGALAEAILDRFVKNGTYGIVTTHYQNLKHYAENCPTVVNGAMLYDRSTMQPLFMLRIGHPGSSFAIEIARKIGLPAEVIDYAANLVGRDYVMSDKYLQDIARDKMYWENKRQKVHSREKQLEETLANYEKELESINREKREVMAKAKEEARNLLQESNAKIEKTIRDIKEAQAEKEKTRAIRQELKEFGENLQQNKEEQDRIERKIEKIKRRQERRKNRQTGKKPQDGHSEKTGSGNSRSTAPESKDTAKHTFNIGDYVHLEGQTVAGRVQAISGDSAKVLFGVMNMTLPLTRLLPAEKAPATKTAKVSTFISRQTRDSIYEKKLHFKPEIDVRGYRADEALDTICHYIDDAILLEQSRVRILHGTGTGALRQAIREYLATVSGVKKFHDEHVQFGGAGITVVELE